MNGALFDLSARAKFRITGADRLRYLNGQISNDARKATENSALHACVLNAKGKVNADIFLRADGDSFLIDLETEMREALPARLERYIIADDVQIEDVTEIFSLLHCTGETESFARAEAGAKIARADRFGIAGTDLWLPENEREIVWRELSQTMPTCGETCAEVFRIEQGIPRWGRELTEEIIPTEANLESSAIDYSKGCYIGQEVISRIKMSGQTNKRLCGLVSLSGTPLVADTRLTSDGAEGKDAGWITSATRSVALGREIALAFVKRGFNDASTELNAGEFFHRTGCFFLGLRVRVVGLPFRAGAESIDPL